MLIIPVSRKSATALLIGAGLFFVFHPHIARCQSDDQKQSQKKDVKSSDVDAERSQSSPIGTTADTAIPDLPALEKLLTLAMENNPDIAIAKSKLREAEVELNRTRLQVSRQVLTSRESVLDLRQQVKVARHAIEVRTGSVSGSEFRKLLSQLSIAEADLKYVLGKSPTDAIGK